MPERPRCRCSSAASLGAGERWGCVDDSRLDMSKISDISSPGRGDPFPTQPRRRAPGAVSLSLVVAESPSGSSRERGDGFLARPSPDRAVEKTLVRARLEERAESGDAEKAPHLGIG